MSDDAWERATLLPENGGIGIASVSHMALPCFLSSSSASLPLSISIFPEAEDSVRQAALDMWTASARCEPPVGPAEAQTFSWSKPLSSRRVSDLESKIHDPGEIARFRSGATFESASLFTGLPNSRDGTRLSDDAIEVAVALRLGLQVATPGQCSCGAQLDGKGDHALACRRGVGRHARHRLVNDCIKQALSEAGIVSVLEPVGIIREDGKGPMERSYSHTSTAFPWLGTRQSYIHAPPAGYRPQPSVREQEPQPPSS